MTTLFNRLDELNRKIGLKYFPMIIYQNIDYFKFSLIHYGDANVRFMNILNFVRLKQFLTRFSDSTRPDV